MKKLLYTIFFCCAMQLAFSQTENKDRSKVKKSDCCCEDTVSKCQEMTASLGDSKTVKDVVYDFKSKDIKLPDDWRKLKKGDWLRLKVMNYNPYLYKLVIDSKDSSVPAPIDGKLLGWFLDPANLSGIVANIKAAGNVVPSKLLSETVEFDFRNNATDVNSMQEAVHQVTADTKIPKAKRVQLQYDLEIFEDEVTPDQIIDRQKDTVDRYDSLAAAINRAIEDTQYAITRRFATLRTLYPEHCKSFEAIAANIKNGIEAPISEFRKNLKLMANTAGNRFKQYQSDIAPHLEIVSKTPVLRVKDSLVRLFYKVFAASVFKADSSINNKNMADIITRLENAALLRSCYTSFPMQVTEDIKKITVEFKSRHDSLGIPSYTLPPLLLPLVQPKIWGVSSGINVSFLRNKGFVNKTIAKVTTGADSVYQLVADNQGDAQMGINALAYVGWKSNYGNGKPNYLGLSFGAGMTIESKPKPRVLLGGSFVTGEKNRVLFTIGFIAGPVSRLSNGYEVNAIYNKPATDFLKDVLRVSGFFSINYSFLSK